MDSDSDARVSRFEQSPAIVPRDGGELTRPVIALDSREFARAVVVVRASS